MRARNFIYSPTLTALLILSVFGCRSLPPFPPLDLAQPGWQTRSGQAIWRPERNKAEIVGDLMTSTHPTEGAYVQFSKALPIASGRVRPDGWEIEFAPQGKRNAAPGNPPGRIVWLQLLRALRGEKVSANWQVLSSSPNDFVLEDAGSGERLEVHF